MPRTITNDRDSAYRGGCLPRPAASAQGAGDRALVADAPLAEAAEPFEVVAVAGAGGQELLEEVAELGALGLRERLDQLGEGGAAGAQELGEDGLAGRRQAELEPA